MTVLADISHDDLIAEVQRRLDLGVFGYAGLFSSNQLHYRDMWCDLASTIAAASLQAFDHPQVRMIRVRFHELAGTSKPVPFSVFALNTTLPGVADPAAHQSVWRSAAAE